ncbi:dehydrogenase/reductase SDR family member on chromosome X-like [Mizuhopecten yessoensis]|uniref:WW domain-containing oxidoreductase n=1 Tax=Mizuhopecten yessoensis TaxID=6573 RepID=A0A210Q7Q7_MIZYE|nr:dehydrogenase/reductase SDR family member on chromosome X-like [Mizuhopecten yessoensis]OWF44719.1 WW domain-containing oxidoreductase [Mizuhopecten yessoensis]
MGSTTSFPRVSIPKDNISLVTGGNAGIGYHTAKWLAMMGGTVIIACRSEEKANQAIQQMNKEFTEEKQKQTVGVVDYEQLNVEFMSLNLNSLKSVMNFVETYKASGRKLHKLYCNAGIGLQDKVSYTEDGHEQIFQVNYLSHFLMVSHLLPVMKSSGPDCRIVLLSSLAHRSAHFDAADIEGKKYSEPKYDSTEIYGRSKVYMIMQMFSLNEILKDTNVTVLSLHPGIVRTVLLSSFGRGIVKPFLALANAFGATKSPFEGAWTSLNAGVNPELVGVRDVYFSDSKPKSSTAASKNKSYQEALWAYSIECLKDYLPENILRELQ